jgi:uncharacterized protein (TIGR03435 family)
MNELREELAMKLLAAVVLVSIATWGQDPPKRPQFSVASLKPGDQNCLYLRPDPPSSSPGRLELPCVTLEELLQAAFGTCRDGASIDLRPLHVEGGPEWMRWDVYRLSAKADGQARTELMFGPMLQVFLEKRLALKARLETRQVPVYSMTVAEGGLKAEPVAACTPLPQAIGPKLPPEKRGLPLPPLEPCGVSYWGHAPEGDFFLGVRESKMTQLAWVLSQKVGRTVVDKTGIAGRFTFRVDFPPLGSISQFSAQTRAGLFAALQRQVGLKLSPDKRPESYLVIDHVEKPSANQ